MNRAHWAKRNTGQANTHKKSRTCAAFYCGYTDTYAPSFSLMRAERPLRSRK
jgi:hypothetical protein